MISNKPIMIVDDSIVDVLLIQNAFQELNVDNQTIVCNNGQEALQYLNKLSNRDEYPGIILLDINMPKMNGLELLNLLKQDEELRIIPVVILTTSDNPKDKEESYKNYAAGYLVKPLEYNEFIEMMQSLKDFWHSSKVAY